MTTIRVTEFISTLLGTPLMPRLPYPRSTIGPSKLDVQERRPRRDALKDLFSCYQLAHWARRPKQPAEAENRSSSASGSRSLPAATCWKPNERKRIFGPRLLGFAETVRRLVTKWVVPMGPQSSSQSTMGGETPMPEIPTITSQTRPNAYVIHGLTSTRNSSNVFPRI